MVKTWIVYKHVSPSNKVYVGITSQSNIKRRLSEERRGIIPWKVTLSKNIGLLNLQQSQWEVVEALYLIA